MKAGRAFSPYAYKRLSQAHVQPWTAHMQLSIEDEKRGVQGPELASPQLGQAYMQPWAAHMQLTVKVKFPKGSRPRPLGQRRYS